MRQRNLPILAFGHSYGGLVTASSILAEPEGVSGVALTGPVILSPTPWLIRRAAGAVARVMPGAPVPGHTVSPATLIHDPAAAARAERDPQMYGRPTTLRVGATALEVAEKLWRGAGRWSVPLAIWHGTEDVATDHDRSKAFVAAVGAPLAEFRSVHNGRHELLHDRVGNDAVTEEILTRFAIWTDHKAAPE